jgi:hypothetical protein
MLNVGVLHAIQYDRVYRVAEHTVLKNRRHHVRRRARSICFFLPGTPHMPGRPGQKGGQTNTGETYTCTHTLVSNPDQQ